MLLEDALTNPDARRVLDKLVGRRVSNPEGGLNNLTLSAAEVPAFGPERRAGQADAAWEALQAYAAAGLILITLGKSRPGHDPYELSPKVRLVESEFERACKLLGRDTRTFSRTEVWMQALEKAFPGENELHGMLAGNWFSVNGMSLDEVAGKLRMLRDIRVETTQLLLRHVSSRLFDGNSKVLDGREAVICAILGIPECPFPASPVQLQVQLPNVAIKGILLIENTASFEQLRTVREARPVLDGLAIAQAHGFRGAARRIRRRGGCSIYYSGEPALLPAFESFWFGDAGDLPVAFWGDLDFSGLAILRVLRAVFPQASAWEPGYRMLLDVLGSGGGHSPMQASKDRQQHPVSTGCVFADSVLLPAMEKAGKFVDQETVLF